MTILGYFSQFCITVLARFSTKFIIFLTGSLLFPVIFNIELEYFVLKLNKLKDLYMSYCFRL